MTSLTADDGQGGHFFGRDLAAGAGGALVYSFALGIATLLMPLIALAHGYGRPAVGFLTAASAVSQMGVRSLLGVFMRRWGDWLLVFTAGLLLMASLMMMAASTTLVVFLLAELLQGAARACFWTGSQTHVVRGVGSGMHRLAIVNVASSVGLLLGPTVGGVIASRSMTSAVLVGASVAGLGLVPPLFLDRLPPFLPNHRDAGSLWFHRGVDAGALAGMAAGGWRGLVSSYVPVALDHVGTSPSLIGVLISASNATGIAGAAVSAMVPIRFIVWSMTGWIVATGTGAALTAPLAANTGLVTVALCLAGMGAGALQTLGPTVASDAVPESRRGDAIAVAGTARAFSLLATPLAVGAAIAIIPLDAVMVAVGLLICAPVVIVGRSRPSDGSPEVLADRT